MKKRMLLFSLIALSRWPNLGAATFTVTNLLDSGAGSLRQAILDANVAPGTDRIEFNIPGPGPYRIQPTSPLPDITSPVVIDGTTQPGFSNKPIVELNGALGGGDGLLISAGSSTVQGLVINGLANIGILLRTAGNNVIRGNYIGTDVTGTQSVPNFWGINVFGVSNNRIGGTNLTDRNIISGNRDRGINFYQASGNVVQGNFIGTDITGTNALGNGYFGIILCCSPATNNLIGGTTPEARNVVSGNGHQGIDIESGASANVVQGNFIGTDVNGTAKLGNAADGILIISSPNNLVGGTNSAAGNLISGNGINGVEMIGSATTGSLVQGNLIGTDSTGTSPLGNLGSGVGLFGCASITVGGVNSAARNLISGNAINGLVIATDSGTGTASIGNKVQGNFIGTDKTGLVALGNGEDGIFISAGVSNIIGGSAAGAGNVISANGRFGRVNDGSSGIEIWDGASGNLVQGNTIGTDANGSANLGNKEYGVFIQNSSGNTTGGTTAGAQNLIAFNQKAGFGIQSGTNNPIRGNSIFSNQGLGIDLGLDGVTLNDAGDGDGGPNNRQNYPILSSAFANPDGTTRIQGTLNSSASTLFKLDFFASQICDSSGYGEGQYYLGSAQAMTDASGNAGFSISLLSAPASYQVMTATATDPNGNTSEFSPCLTAGGPDVRLALRVSGGVILISWPSGATSYRLQSAPALSPPVQWSDVSGNISDDGVQKTLAISNSPSLANAFFRLAYP